MKKLTIFSLAAFVAATTFTACNSSTVAYEEEIVTNVGVSSFKLAKNDKVLANLDTVFFSIDLDKAQIFNADSLPYGTRTDTLVPVITMMDMVSKAELKVKLADGRDTVYNYLEKQDNVIDFTYGPAIFTVAGRDSMITRSYTIKINVHKVKSDSLVWSETTRAALPSALATPKAQRTVKNTTATYTLTTNDAEAGIARRANVTDPWDTYAITLPAGALVQSFTATDEALFVLASGRLYKSTDEGRTWIDTGIRMDYIYGNYGTRLLGAVNKNDEWYTTEYPSGTAVKAIAGMPIGGTSQMISYSFDLGQAPVSTFVGGYDSDDNLTGATWAFDGENWACVSTKPVPAGLQDATLVPFFAFNVSNVFVVSRYSVFLAFGGNDGEQNVRGTYVSSDYGRTWSKGGDLIQLPDYIPSLSQAQAYVETLTLHSRSAEGWTSFDTDYRIPADVAFVPFGMPFSRATEPITEWECPYIYLYGGVTSDNVLNPYIWRGTINRLTFKPII